MITLDPKTTALVLIDLQKGIVARELAPYSSAQIVETCKKLAEQFRAKGGTVILVNVAFSKDFKDALPQNVDEPMQAPPGGFPTDFSMLVDGLAEDSDVRVTKKNWGAFYGTDLDLQLRRRGIKTIVLAGVATNMGVESTARAANEHGYDQCIVEDGCATFNAEMHAFSMTKIFPRLSHVVKSSEISLE